MNGNRGAKGSVNDRIISILFRKRYLEYLKKKESYTIDEREKAIEYLKKIKELDIENNLSMLEEEDKKILEKEFYDFNLKGINISDSEETTRVRDISNLTALDRLSEITQSEEVSLKESGKAISEYDPATELYDFDKYDYYEVLTQKTGLSNLDSDEIIDVDKEIEKRSDEKIILKEVNEFIDKSKEELDDIKDEISYIKSQIEYQYTQEQIDDLKNRYNKLNEKIRKLKERYDIIKDKYEFDGYEILDNLTLIESIDDFKTKADLEELELMVDACKYEVEAIDSVVIEEEKSKGVGNDISEKKAELVDRDIEFDKSTKKTIYLSDLDIIIESEAKFEEKTLSELRVKLNKVETQVRRTTDYVSYATRMFGSFLRIAAGILTAPLSGFLSQGLGINLIRRGMRGLRESILSDEFQRTEYVERYRSVETEIMNAKDDVSKTLLMIDDSLEQIEELKKVYLEKFEPYASYIPEYPKLKNHLLDLEKKLKKSKERVKGYDQTLDENAKENKQKVYRSQHPRSAA